MNELVHTGAMKASESCRLQKKNQLEHSWWGCPISWGVSKVLDQSVHIRGNDQSWILMTLIINNGYLGSVITVCLFVYKSKLSLFKLKPKSLNNRDTTNLSGPEHIWGGLTESTRVSKYFLKFMDVVSLRLDSENTIQDIISTKFRSRHLWAPVAWVLAHLWRDH